MEFVWFNNLFCVWAILCICFSVGSSHTKKCKEAERQSLLKLKGGFVNGRKLLSSWKGEDCCKWKGISCDNLTGHVTSLDLEALYYDIDHPLQGEIPQCFSHITALSNTQFARILISHVTGDLLGYMMDGWFYDEATLSWKGKNWEYGKNLGLMTIIDLSCNHLTGKIPQSITKLVALAGLNLSRNNLSGSIPNNIGHMEWLESLDLSRNHLSGRMPASFSNLSFLSDMNLSFNNLSGKITTGTQLQSFNPSSYIGNTRLCGQPLTNHCQGDVMSPTGSPDKHVTDEDEDKFITYGFYISLVLGFIVGFWGVCGTLVIKASWRHAYFQFLNNMNDWMYVTIMVFIGRMKRRF